MAVSTTGTSIQHPRQLLLAKIIWAVLFIASSSYFLVSSYAFFQFRLELCTAEPCSDMQVSTFEHEPYAALGIPVAARVLFLPLMDLIGWLACAALALLIFSKRSDDWIALLTSLLLVMVVGTQVSTVFALPALSPQNVPIAVAFATAGTISAFVFLAYFPNGQLIPRWIWLPMLPFILLDAWHLHGAYTSVDRYAFMRPTLIMIMIGLAGQIYRYFCFATPLQRQQTKWILLGIFITIVSRIIYNVFGLLITDLDTGIINPYFYFPLNLFGSLSLLSMPVSIAFSVLRYRLWDIDLTINRSLVYGSVTLVLTAIFGGIVALAAALTQGQGTTIAVALAALAAGLLFNPLRRQIQRQVDRRIYGLRFDLNELKKAEQPLEVRNPGALTGRTLGDYQVLGVLGTGGMGEVYQGVGKGRTVAIKTMLPKIAEDPAMVSRFEREAQAGMQLEHPHIAKVYAHGESEGSPYLVMDFIEGQDLSRMLKTDGKLDEETISRMMQDICSALDTAHNLGFVHRDLKPANIMIKANGEAVLMDFGITKVADATHSLTGTGAIGTIDYMAPEQIMSAKEVDKRADVYALGVMVYELITGQRPFSGSPAQVMFAHIQQPAPDPYDINPEIPRTVSNAIMRAMEKSPEDRYQSAGDFAAALQ